MRRNRWIAATLTGAVLALGLAACDTVTEPPDEPPDGYLISYTVPLPDGRAVQCVSYKNGLNVSPISCDWDYAK